MVAKHVERTYFYGTIKSYNNEDNNQIINTRTFNHLTITDGINIQKLLALKSSTDYNSPKSIYSYIAPRIGVNKSTISREIKRGTFTELDGKTGKSISRYLYTYGQGGADKNKSRPHYKYKLSKDSI